MKGRIVAVGVVGALIAAAAFVMLRSAREEAGNLGTLRHDINPFVRYQAVTAIAQIKPSQASPSAARP